MALDSLTAQYLTIRFDRAAGFDTASPYLRSNPFDIFATSGGEYPLAVGHVWLLLALNANAAAMRPSLTSPIACVKSSATEHPGTEVPRLVVGVFAGENPSV
jgi:hypothetical protein